MGHERAGGVDLDAIVDDVVSVRRQIATLQAREARLLADALELTLTEVERLRAAGGRRSSADLPLRETSAELAAAMRLSDRSVQGRMGDALALVTDFAATMVAWEAGRIDAGHVSAILDAGVGIADPALRTRFESLVLDAATHESPARLRAIAKAQAAAIDPVAARERLAAGAGRRGVRLVDLDDGLARLLVDVPAVPGYAIHDRLTQMARAVRDGDGAADVAHGGDDSVADATTTAHSEGDEPEIVTAPGTASAAVSDASADDEPAADTRTMDQLRADILCDLLLGGVPTAHGDGLDAIKGHVQVTVPVQALSGATDEPALLAGYGPVDADTARRLAGNQPGCDRMLTDPVSGGVLAVDRYRWNRDLERFLRARDERCRFPGCRRPARRCDVDHTIDAALGGPTRDDNLAHLCRRHHTLKHATAWTVRQRPGGVLEWHSPLGRQYTDRPPATVRFIPDACRSEWSGAPPGARDHSDDPPPF